MLKRLSILIGKSIILAGRILHRGSSLPGQIALKINPQLLKQIKYPKTVIAVTGSSGKGSISTIVAKLFRDQGYSVAHNSAGSNLSAGIATLMLEHCNMRGTIKTDIIVCEIDERYAKFVFPYLVPSHVIVSNISRDQPPRQGHFDLVYDEIKKALIPGMHLILNGDDPMLRKFNLNQEYDVTYYTVDQNQYSYDDSLFKNLNMTHCPICHSKLKYTYYHFETLGTYHCSKCDFKNPDSNYHVTNIDYDNFTIQINDKHTVLIPYNVLYCIYNTLASFTVASVLNLDEEKIAESITNMNRNKKNFDIYQYQNRYVHVLNNKNENSTTFNQSLLYLNRYPEEKTIVVGWKEISRRYNFDDLSWLYDIDFELLNHHNINKMVCVGLHRYDIATRMKYANIDEDKIVVFETLEEATHYIKEKTDGNIYAVLNFDYVTPFNQLMKEDEKK